MEVEGSVLAARLGLEVEDCIPLVEGTDGDDEGFGMVIA